MCDARRCLTCESLDHRECEPENEPQEALCPLCCETVDLCDCWDPDEAICPGCGGEGFWLGTLGPLHHFRCRQCGIDFTGDLTLEED